MRIRVLVLVLAAALGLGVSAAQAVPIFSILGGSPGSVAQGVGGNDLVAALGYGAPILGSYGAQVEVSGPGDFVVSFLGKEAGWNNTFRFLTAFFQNSSCGGNPCIYGGASQAVNVGAGDLLSGNLLPFSFGIPGDSSYRSGTAANGSNPSVGDTYSSSLQIRPNFFAAYDPHDANSILLWLDDGGGGGYPSSDDNHDDMVIRITAVPEPGSMLLLGSGLFALLARRRRS